MSLNNSLDGLAEAGLEVGGFFGGLVGGGFTDFLLVLGVIGSILILFPLLIRHAFSSVNSAVNKI